MPSDYGSRNRVIRRTGDHARHDSVPEVIRQGLVQAVHHFLGAPPSIFGLAVASAFHNLCPKLLKASAVEASMGSLHHGISVHCKDAQAQPHASSGGSAHAANSQGRSGR